MNFVSNILWNSVEGFVEAGTRTAGGYAGDALIKAGDLIESGGRSVGTGLENKFTGVGTKISGQTYTPSGKALPSTARKPALKRSNSSPAATRTTGPTSKTPIGAKKHPGPNAGGKAAAGTKQLTSGAKSVTGGVGGGLSKAAGAAPKAIKAPGAAAASKPLPKAYPNNVPYGAKTKPSDVNSKAKNNPLPQPYGAPAFSNEKKTAVKPGQSKPFVPPTPGAAKAAAAGANPSKPYPGTNTLPGQASKTPVKKYKPIERMQGVAEKGKMTHIAV